MCGACSTLQQTLNCSAAAAIPPFSVKATFESYFGQPKGQRILIVGCGLSAIPAQMHALGYRCITAMDIAPTAIALMQAGDQGKEGVECKPVVIYEVSTHVTPVEAVIKLRG